MADAELQAAIAWSSHLDPIFASNLERDPALSWQYFGSRAGFLRRFPGTSWPHDAATENKPLSDFRVDDWFIQAAASPKDVVSLIFFVFFCCCSLAYGHLLLIFIRSFCHFYCLQYAL